ncbi:MAG: methylmalonyl Co-A mutase-associated GTPase MeaB [Zestosphaera sp.]
MSIGVEELINRALHKEKASVGKLITLIETDPITSLEVLGRIPCHPKKSHVIGFTGSAGVGKSTLINAVATLLAREGRSVAVMAVDPKSPLTGGAVMGDRVRMKDVPKEVYIRSMTTGEEESLPLKTVLTMELFERLGYDNIIIETPGAGQFNIRVMKAVDTVVVVLMPEAGDEIQAIKAGMMEIGDIYVVNKSDLPGANLTYSQVLFAINSTERVGWAPKVHMTNALSLISVEPLVSSIKEHWEFLKANGLETAKRVMRRSLELQLIASEEINNALKIVSAPGNTLYREYEDFLKRGGSIRDLRGKIRKELINALTDN